MFIKFVVMQNFINFQSLQISMSLWFAKEVKKTVRGIVVTGENIEGTRTVDVLLTEDVLKKLKELMNDEGA